MACYKPSGMGDFSYAWEGMARLRLDRVRLGEKDEG